jgi:hypothetical protein
MDSADMLRLYPRLVAALNLAYARLTDKEAREEIGALLREIDELEQARSWSGWIT